MVQFHQSYSYEDFIQGFRPNPEGGFFRKDGVFMRFCQRAEKDLGSPYFFIIDEINRGNLSKIFGELMMLIEADKRGAEHAVPLTYSDGDERFSIPENVHIIGTMNTADRSLAMVDYALRRRFAFFDLPPQFNEKFKSFLLNQGITEPTVNQVMGKLSSLNQTIRNDKNLGAGFEIGHSYFCSVEGVTVDQEDEWFNHIIDREVGPQLLEFWFDDKAKAEAEIAKLKSHD
jgi:5-methylcytosine-specific restriction endonuclease McrBC GTP-binding regulatory subunit McrB